MTYLKEERMEEDPKLRILSICHSLLSMPLSSLGPLLNVVFLHKRWWLSLVGTLFLIMLNHAQDISN